MPKIDNRGTKSEFSLVNQMMVNLNAFNSEVSSKTILPTFTATLVNGKQMHCLKDSACQANFISEEIATREGLSTISNIDIDINGFNTSKNYSTKVVKVLIKLNGAIVVPKINTQLELPGLGLVVGLFERKGYKLADSLLTSEMDAIPKLDFILGANSSYCIPETNVLFGKFSNCIFSNTPIGVLLYGR